MLSETVLCQKTYVSVWISLFLVCLTISLIRSTKSNLAVAVHILNQCRTQWVIMRRWAIESDFVLVLRRLRTGLRERKSITIAERRDSKVSISIAIELFFFVISNIITDWFPLRKLDFATSVLVLWKPILWTASASICFLLGWVSIWILLMLAFISAFVRIKDLKSLPCILNIRFAHHR